MKVKKVTFVVAAALGASALSPAILAQRLNIPLEAPDAEVEVFVRLSTPSVAELNIEAKNATGKLASRAVQQAQAAKVRAEQSALRPVLQSLGATEQSSLRVGANGLRVTVPASEIATIASLPGVISVGRVEHHTINHAESVPATGAPQVWQSLALRGEGIRVGIIDTGIDYTHANFGGPGTVAAYGANNRAVIEPGTFPTAKVVGGWDFAGAAYNAGSPNPALRIPTPDPDPIDVNGHGTHVAGTAAGSGTATVAPGVAPQALLYAIKVFGDGGGSTALTADGIEWALDPNGDGDMSDHLDVINMSLGSSFGWTTDPSSISSQNAAELGIIVVASAGNSGNVPYITGAPGVAPAAISTAAVSPAGRKYARLDVTAPGPVAGLKTIAEGAGPVQLKDVAAISGTVVRGNPLLGCSALTNAAEVAGNIVLLQRGACGFLVKYQQAQAAGARAVIMANSAAGAPISMGGLNSTVTIPGVMVGLADGNALIAASSTLGSSPLQATLDAAFNPAFDNQIAGFSSRGPGNTGSGLKPEIAAPGVNIVSAGVGAGSGPSTLSGTSMAAPHVAGAAALLRQRHPTLAQWEIKALLMNSATDVNPSSDTHIARAGVGSMRVDRAVALTSYAAPGGLAFGRINPTTPTTDVKSLTMRNLSNKPRRFQVTHRPQQTYPGVTVTCPNPVSIGPSETRTAVVRLQFDPRVAPAQGVFDNASRSQTEVDGWCVFSDGVDELRVGYLAVVDPASAFRVNVLNAGGVHRVRNQGPGIGQAEAFTLVGSGGTSALPATHPIEHVGIRSVNFGADSVAEFAVALGGIYENPAGVRVTIEIDANKDGIVDARLIADDVSRFTNQFPAGDYLTAQFTAAGSGFLDWSVVGFDYNDQTLILPFTRAASGGLLPDSFNYRIETSSRDGTTSEQSGSFDFADEIRTDLANVALAAGEQVQVRANRTGSLLWLFRNNVSTDQAHVHRIVATP